jgi:hypothetical protein
MLLPLVNESGDRTAAGIIKAAADERKAACGQI